MARDYTVAYFTAEMMIPEIPGFFRGGLGDLAGHTPEGMIKRGIRVIPITIGYPFHWQTGQPIDYGRVPGMHYLFDLDVDIYFPSVRKRVPIFAIDRGGAQTYLIYDPDAGILYPSDDGLSLRQSAFYGRAAQALLKRLGEKPDIAWYQEWRAACGTMPNLMMDPYFEGMKHLYTSHTSRPEALPTFPVEWYDGLAIDRRFYNSFVTNGRIDPDRGCIRLADMVNGVSEEHGEVLRAMHPDRAEIIGNVLNGGSINFMRSHRLKRYAAPDDLQLWVAHQGDKNNFITFVNEYLAKYNIGTTMNPNNFTVALVRRLAKYKNQKPMFESIIRKLCAKGINVIIGGVAHEGDDVCQSWMKEFTSWMNDPGLKGQFAYVAEYNENIRRMAVQGCDVWVECPWKRSEACGTGIFGAWMNGNIVVATKGGGAKEHGIEINSETGEGDALFIEPYEPRMLEQQLLKLHSWFNNFIINGDKLWPRLRKNCYEGAEKLDIPYMIERYEKNCFEPLLINKQN